MYILERQPGPHVQNSLSDDVIPSNGHKPKVIQKVVPALHVPIPRAGPAFLQRVLLRSKLVDVQRDFQVPCALALLVRTCHCSVKEAERQ